MYVYELVCIRGGSKQIYNIISSIVKYQESRPDHQYCTVTLQYFTPLKKRLFPVWRPMTMMVKIKSRAFKFVVSLFGIAPIDLLLIGDRSKVSRSKRLEKVTLQI